MHQLLFIGQVLFLQAASNPMDGAQETLEASQENRSSTVADAAGANIIDDALEYDLEEQVPW